MEQLRYTLLTDGTSDAVLMPIIDWLLRQHLSQCRIYPQFAKGLGPVGLALDNRLPIALKMYPCDILFVHRDAEKATHKERVQEIDQAMAGYDQVYVPVVPKRMLEAWLFSDEQAIRRAAGNRNGRNMLNLPVKSRWESMPDPKMDLTRVITDAAEKSARALAKMNMSLARRQVAEFTEDFSRLRGLPSFDLVESRLVESLRILKNAVD